MLDSLQLKNWFAGRGKIPKWTAHDQIAADFYSQFISPDDVCFDVGANTGSRTRIFLKLSAFVVAVEPQEECVRILRKRCGKDRRLEVIPEALGAADGRAEMLISNADTLSSMSAEWIRAIQDSGRFSAYRWDRKTTVPVTTLDRLIDRYGEPSFIKIDVEGYEYEVVKGLSKAVRALSLEFAAECVDNTMQCIRYLESLGDIRLNYSLGESMKLILGSWIKSDEMEGVLSALKRDRDAWGDVYVQFAEPRAS